MTQNVLRTGLFDKLSKFFLFRLYKYYIIDSIIIVKKSGFRELLKRRGWKFFLVIAGYYTVRDTVLYILIPYFIARGVL
jgi:hypothetical protein